MWGRGAGEKQTMWVHQGVVHSKIILIIIIIIIIIIVFG